MARNPRIKRANAESQLTIDQGIEIQRCMYGFNNPDTGKYETGPVYFAKNYVRIQHPTRGDIPFLVYDYQENMINTFLTNNKTVVLSARQTGKSTVSSMYLLWFALFNPNKTILIAANKNKNAMEMIGRIQYAYEYVPMWMKPGVKDDGWNKHELKFDNDSRIVSEATSENSGRGMSISLLYLDEFAFVKPSIQEEFWTSILPTLSTGGGCIMTSTPNGATDKFSTIWRASTMDSNTDGVQFEPIHVKWDEPPGRDAAFKAEQLSLLGETKWAQEYECEFISSDPLLIDSMILQILRKKVIKYDVPIKQNMGFTFWQDIEPHRTYLVGVDPATGTGSDFTVINVFDFETLTQVAQFRSNTMSSPVVYTSLKYMLNLIENRGSNAYFSIENNGVGEGALALYEADETPPESDFISEEKGNRLGMRTESRVKLHTCLAMKRLIETENMVIKSTDCITELSNFISTKGSYAAQTGATDDIISSLLVVIRVLDEMATYDQRAFDMMNDYSKIDKFAKAGLDRDNALDSDDGEEYDDDFEPDALIF